MDKDKSPMLDGFSMFFYQICWESIKVDLLDIFHEFYERGTFHKGVSYTFIALIPEFSGPSLLSDYLPISLIGSLYKIISKVLSCRLRIVMHGMTLGINLEHPVLCAKLILRKHLIKLSGVFLNECFLRKVLVLSGSVG